MFEASPYFHTELNTRGNRRHVWLLKSRIWHATNTEFQVVGEREMKTVADLATTIELKVLDELFT